MACCGPAKWKREEIPDHKFDYVDVEDFVEESVSRRFSYMLVFMYTLKSILVYMADLGVLVLMITTDTLSRLFQDTNQTPQTPSFGTPTSNSLVCSANATPPSGLAKWVLDNPKFTIISIAASIALSFTLLAIDWRKAMAVIRSRDISYAFTSTIAYRYYAIRSYAHYCFFSQIQNSRKTTDLVAFFVFFRFKGWMRLLMAEFPRQFINAINIYSALNSCLDPNDNGDFFPVVYAKSYAKALRMPNIDGTKKALLVLSTITVTIWLLSAISLLLAFFMYIPLLCTIRGNLKEYCVHKIDKRIGELLRRKSRKRMQEARKAEMRELEANRMRNGNNASDGGSVVGYPTINSSAAGGVRPTLPDIDVDLDSQYQGYAPSVRSYAPVPTTYASSVQSGYAGTGYGMQAAQPVPTMPMMPPTQYGYGGSPSMYGQYAQRQSYATPMYAQQSQYAQGNVSYAASEYGSEYAYWQQDYSRRPSNTMSVVNGGSIVGVPAAMSQVAYQPPSSNLYAMQQQLSYGQPQRTGTPGAPESAYGAQYASSSVSHTSHNDQTLSSATPLVRHQQSGQLASASYDTNALPPSQPMQRMQ